MYIAEKMDYKETLSKLDALGRRMSVSALRISLNDFEERLEDVGNELRVISS